jgi:hypothetical protein
MCVVIQFTDHISWISLQYIFYFEYICVIPGSCTKKILRRVFSYLSFNILGIYGRVPYFLTIVFDYLSVDGVVHIWYTTL